MIYIYTLKDPITNDIRYVGKTINLNKRFIRHIYDSKKSTKAHKNAWIKSLLIKQLLPIIEVIDIVTEDEWKFWEQYWICQVKAWGYTLLNITEGGEGKLGTVGWNKGTKGIMKVNSGSFKKGKRVSIKTEIKTGQRLSPKTEFKKGNVSFNCIEINQYDLNRKLLNTYKSIEEAAVNINVTSSAIRNCIYRKTYKCKNFLWMPKEINMPSALVVEDLRDISK